MYADFDKARNVMGIFYPSSEKTYGAFLEFLEELHVPAACSPVHDKDEYTPGDVQKWIKRHTDSDGNIDMEAIEKGMPKVGQCKKPHVHFMICANGPQTPQWFYDRISEFFDISYIEKVNSVSAMLRYFAHLDSPMKHQYSALEVHGFGGFDLSPLLKQKAVTSIETLLDVMDFIAREKITRYNQLVKWSMTTGDMDTIACVTGRASYFSAYFRAEFEEKEAKRKREEALSKQNECSPDF